MVRTPKPAILDAMGRSHVAIEASAGTGKTFTLEHLVIDLLLGGLRLEELLVVTFTHKATLELKARVRAKLTELLALREDRGRSDEPCWELDDVAQERLQEALGSFDRAAISTIHGFGQQVLGESAFEGGRLLRQEAITKEDAFDGAYRHLLRTTFATDHSDLLALGLKAMGGIEGLRSLLLEAMRESDGLDLPSFISLRALLEDFPVDLAQACLAQGSRAFGYPGGPRKVPVRLEKLLELRQSCLEAGTPEAFWEDGDWLKKTLVTGLEDSLYAADLKGDALKLGRAVATLVNLPGLLVAAFLSPLQEAMRRRKLEEGLYDFDDMIALVAEALEGPQGEALVHRLRARYRVALIDEFQDTDARQWSIFRRVFLESPDGHRLILVGDPKQAIYGFRSGDLPTYEAALAAVRAKTGQEPLQLTRNFRSTEAVLQVLHRLLEGTTEAPFFTGGNAPHYRMPVSCGKPALRFTDDTGAELPALRSVDVPVGKGVASHRRALGALVGLVRDTLAVGHFHDPARSRTALGPEDVFVLTRTAREGQEVARALRQAGVPAALYRQDGLFQGPEAAACRDLLLAIASPIDECRRAKAFLGPFFGLTFAEVERVRELPEGHPLLERLFAWQELARSGRWSELFSRVVGDGGLSARLLFLEAGERTLTNLLHILELLQQEARGGHRTLEDLAHTVQRWIDGVARPAVEDGDTQRLERVGGLVQVLTMHKAKGLEAPVVALYGVGKGMDSDLHRYHREGERRAWVGSLKLAPPEVKRAVEEEAAEEFERLAYVALTRAKAQLLLPRFVRDGEPPASGSSFDVQGHPKQGPLRSVNLRLQALLGTPEAPIPQRSMERLPLDQVWPVPAAGPEATLEVVLPDPFPTPAFDALRRSGRPWWLFSFTGLHQGLERQGGPLTAAVDERREPVSESGPRGGAKLGTQVHAFMEQVDPRTFQGRTLAEWAGLPATRELAEALLPENGRGTLLRWAFEAWTRELLLPDGQRGALWQAEVLLRELDFLTPYPGRPDLLTGSIDLLFRFGGRAFVLDWKTNQGAPEDPAWLEATVTTEYHLQVKVYTVTACRFLGIRDAEAYRDRFGGVVYVFLRGLPEGGIWSRRPTWGEVQAWERELEALQPERLIPIHAGGERHG